jgi:hypothetical protein
MSKKNFTFVSISIAVICLLAAWILAATGSKIGNTYTNPVLVETVLINRSEPDNFNGVLGIGDPAVLFHQGKYFF